MAEQQRDSKLRWQAQIEQSLTSGKFAEAMTLIHKSLAEFPDDPDLLALEEKITQARERSVQVFQLVEEGRQLCGEGKFEEGLDTLRGAYSLDERNTLARSALIDNLLCQALAVLETDFVLAEKLSQEAHELDPLNPVNKSVIQSIREYRELKPATSPTPPADKPLSGGAAPLSAPLSTPASAPLKAPAKAQAPPDRAAGGMRPGAAPASSAQNPAPAPRTELSTAAPSLKPTPTRAATPATTTGVPPAAPGLTSGRVAPLAPAPGASRPAMNSAAAATRASQGSSLPAAGSTTPKTTSKMTGGEAPSPRLTPPVTGASVPPSAASRRVGTPASPPRSAASQAPRPGAAGRSVKKSFDGKVIAAAVLAAVLCGGLLVMVLHRRSRKQELVSVGIHTVPAGAAVRINGQPYDISHEISLARGSYKMEAELDGYQPLEQNVQIKDQRQSIELTLAPVMPALLISTDLASGAVALDDQSAVDLQNGQLSLASLPPGEHTLRITSGRSGEAVIGFAAAPNVAPVLAHPISAKNLRVVMLGSYGGQGRLYSSFGPASLRLDGQMAGKLSPETPLLLPSLSAASHELVLGDADDRQTISVEVSPAAALFVSITSDRNVGTLEIVANEKDFQLEINGKPVKIVTRRGRNFVYNLDASSASVSIAKAGFDATPAQQQVVIRKDAVTRVSFQLAPVPTTATLHFTGVLAGTHVTVDAKPYELQPDGALSATIAPGDHVIALTRPGFRPKTIHVSAKAGETVAVGGGEVLVNDAATGRLTIASRTPAAAVVVLRHGSTETPVPGREAEAPEGDYTLVATAPGYRDESQPVHIDEKTPAVAEVKLVAIPQIVRMEGWDDPKAWRLENGWYTRKGGAFVLFQGSSSTGTIEFTARHKGRQLPIFRGGRLQWVVHYINSSNYDLYQIDEQKISWKRFVDGKPGPEKQAPHGVKIKDQTYRLRIEVGGPEIALELFDGQAWKALPQLETGGAKTSGGRFGFYLPGDDEMWLTDFAFTPKQ